jgi:hypothetical protein
MSTELITLANVGQALVEAMPELRNAHQQEIRSWSGGEPPGAYTIFHFVLDPLFVAEFESGKNRDFLQRTFNFFEQMARSNDLEVVNLLWIEIWNRSLLVRGSFSGLGFTWGLPLESLHSKA